MDSIFGIGLPELFFIAILSLIILGPERLPGTLRQVAKAWGYTRNLGRELTAQFSEEFKDLQDLDPRKLLNELADEELAKDIKSLNDGMKKSTPASKAVSTTTKPSSTAAKSSTAKSTTAKSSTAKSSATDATAKTTQPAPAPSTDGVEPPQSEAATTANAEAIPGDGDEKTILPPKQNEPAPPTGQSEAVKPAADEPTALTPVTTGAPVSVNGASDPAESAA
jgi:sec-independent protein translocase protein TatB